MTLEMKIRKKAKVTFEDSDNQFHNFQHSKEFVEAAKKLCERENVGEEDRKNIVIAGWLHDIGAVEGYEGHVERGVQKAEKILQEMKVDREKVEQVKDLIAATDPTREPENKLEEIMQDSDAAFLAREDYFQKLEQMWKEFKEQDVFEGSKMDFFEDSISYIDIEYHTDAAKQLFDEKRQVNLRKLKEKVK